MHLSIMILNSDRVLNPKYTLIPASTEHNIEKPNSSRAETGSTIHITLLWHVLSALTTAPGRLGMTMVSAADPELAMYVQGGLVEHISFRIYLTHHNFEVS